MIRPIPVDTCYDSDYKAQGNRIPSFVKNLDRGERSWEVSERRMCVGVRYCQKTCGLGEVHVYADVSVVCKRTRPGVRWEGCVIGSRKNLGDLFWSPYNCSLRNSIGHFVMNILIFLIFWVFTYKLLMYI